MSAPKTADLAPAEHNTKHSVVRSRVVYFQNPRFDEGGISGLPRLMCSQLLMQRSYEKTSNGIERDGDGRVEEEETPVCSSNTSSQAASAHRRLWINKASQRFRWLSHHSPSSRQQQCSWHQRGLDDHVNVVFLVASFHDTPRLLHRPV